MTAKWKQGEFLNIPLDVAALIEMWKDGDEINREHLPSWMEDMDPDEIAEWRYCGNKSWAYIARNQEENYWIEMDELSEAGVCLVGDEGDGCITHFYLQQPETSEIEVQNL